MHVLVSVHKSKQFWDYTSSLGAVLLRLKPTGSQQSASDMWLSFEFTTCRAVEMQRGLSKDVGKKERLNCSLGLCSSHVSCSYPSSVQQHEEKRTCFKLPKLVFLGCERHEVKTAEEYSPKINLFFIPNAVKLLNQSGYTRPYTSIECIIITATVSNTVFVFHLFICSCWRAFESEQYTVFRIHTRF